MYTAEVIGTVVATVKEPSLETIPLLVVQKIENGKTTQKIIAADCTRQAGPGDFVYLIGSKVGYPDAVSFARVFKEEIGCTPSEYRSMHAPGEEG